MLGAKIQATMTHHNQQKNHKQQKNQKMIVVVMKNLKKLKSQIINHLQAKSIQHLLRNQPWQNTPSHPLQPTHLLLLPQVLALRVNGNVDQFPQTIILWSVQMLSVYVVTIKDSVEVPQLQILVFVELALLFFGEIILHIVWTHLKLLIVPHSNNPGEFWILLELRNVLTKRTAQPSARISISLGVFQLLEPYIANVIDEPGLLVQQPQSHLAIVNLPNK